MDSQNGDHKEILADLSANLPESDVFNMPQLGTHLSDLGTGDSEIKGNFPEFLPDSIAVDFEVRDTLPVSGSNLAGAENGETEENLPVSNLPNFGAENGEIEQNLSVSDPTRLDLGPQNGDPNTEMESLMAANQDLVNEIGSSRVLNAEMEEKSELLRKELQGSSERAEALIAEIASLEEEKWNSEDAAASLVRELEALHAEKRDMEVENRKAVAENKSMDTALSDSMEKFSLLGNHLDEKQTAMAGAQTRVHLLCFEIEKLQLEKEEYLKEFSVLNASNGNTAAQVNQLQGEEKALSNEIENILTAKASAEQKASEAKAAIAVLRTEISEITESDGNLQKQLNEARVRIQYLEEQDHLMAAREGDLETQILDLESKLHALKSDHGTTLQAFEQEIEAKAGLSRTLEVAHMQINGLERDLDSSKLSFDLQESGANTNRQRLRDLEGRTTELLEQNQALAIANADLEAVLRRLRSGSQEEQETKELDQLKGEIRILGDALTEAHVLAEKELQLKSRVQELTVLANRKSMLAGLASPLILSSSTIVVGGLLVFLLHSKSR